MLLINVNALLDNANDLYMNRTFGIHTCIHTLKLNPKDLEIP